MMDKKHLREDLESYLEAHSEPEGKILAELNRYTHLNVIHPQMLSGPVLGGFLRMISRMLQPRSILEIGTYTGYSAICLASGLSDNGRLTTIEVNDEIAEIASGFFKKAGIGDRIDLLVGDALDILPTLDRAFDLVFIDANKEHYIRYFDLIIDKVNPGAYIIADNVLWDGKVMDPSFKDPSTETIRQFNYKITGDERVENILLPVRDGIILIRKKLV